MSYLLIVAIIVVIIAIILLTKAIHNQNLILKVLVNMLNKSEE